MQVLSPHKLATIIILNAIIGISSGYVRADEVVQTRQLHSAVEYRVHRVDSSAGVLTLHMVLIDRDALRDGSIVLEPWTASENLGQVASPQSIARRANAIAAINGPYFANAGGRTYPLGFTVMGGRIVQLGNLNRPLVGIDQDGEFRTVVAHPKAFVTSDTYFEPIWLWGVNTQAGDDAVTLYDSNWGYQVSPQGGTVVAVSPVDSEESTDSIVIDFFGDEDDIWDGIVTEISDSGSIAIPADGYVLIFHGRTESAVERYQPGTGTAVYVYDLPEDWASMIWIATLGPWFIQDGHYRDFSDETGYGADITGRANRSMIGTTWNDEVFFAITRGAGLNVRETAEVLVDYNVRDAVMCDSGGSSGLWVDGLVGHSRPVPLAFVVREPDGETSEVSPLNLWTERLFRY